MRTPKHIHDAIRNTLRSVAEDLTLPQTRAAQEILAGLLRNHTPILNHLNTGTRTRMVKQTERYRRHLENIDIAAAVEERLFRTLPAVEEDTVIAYDLGDIAKPHAEKMEGISGIFDGSAKAPSVGYHLHGVAILNQPVVMEVHDAERETLNQTRLRVIDRVVQRIGRKGIWVFDRGNDGGRLFAALCRRKLRFLIRLRKNRHLVERCSGVLQAVEDFPPGIHEVHMPGQRWNFTLVVYEHAAETTPMRVLVRGVEAEDAEDIIATYLLRWEIENLYRQVKEKFQLERIRLLSWQKLRNLLALIQLAMSISNRTFAEMVEDPDRRFELSVTFRAFCHHRSLTENRFAFTSFLSMVAPSCAPRSTTINPLQRSLFPRHVLRQWTREMMETAKMGVS